VWQDMESAVSIIARWPTTHPPATRSSRRCRERESSSSSRSRRILSFATWLGSSSSPARFRSSSASVSWIFRRRLSARLSQRSTSARSELMIGFQSHKLRAENSTLRHLFVHVQKKIKSIEESGKSFHTTLKTRRPIPPQKSSFWYVVFIE
jgi:hypothetical protein